MRSTTGSPRTEELSVTHRPTPVPHEPARSSRLPRRWGLGLLAVAAVVAVGVWLLRPKAKDPAASFESDVGRLQDGMRANFTVDAWPGVAFEGVIRQIRNASQTVQNVVTYDAVIDVANPELKLKPGMTANVTFVTAHRENVVTVPNALRFRPPEPTEGAARPGPGVGGAGVREKPAPGTKTVFVLREGRPRPVRVKPGVTDGSYTEVEGELREGEQVITALAAGAQSTQGTGSAPRTGAGGGRAGGGFRPPGPF